MGTIERNLPYFFFFSFFFFSIEFSIFFLELYNLTTSVCAKMPTLRFGKKCWPVGPRVFSYKIYLSLFVYRISILFLRPLYLLSTSSHAKTPILNSSQNCSPVKIFLKDFQFFFGLLYSIYKFSCKNTDIAFWSKLLTR